jgi:hypothetical protein
MQFLTFTIAVLLVLVSARRSHAANDSVLALVEEFLAKVNLTIPPTGTGYKWMTLCQLTARAENGLQENQDTQSCTYTAHGEVQEVRVKQDVASSRCSSNDELYASGTMLTYENYVSNQYDAAMKLVGDAKYKAELEMMQSMKAEHIQNLKVAANKDTAKLTATAKSAPWYGGGGNCDLTLEGYVNQLF